MSMIGVSSSGNLISLRRSTVTIDGGSILINEGTNAYQIMNAGILNIDTSVDFDCATIVNFFGSGTCGGGPLPH